jgi:hypothetical protein
MESRTGEVKGAKAMEMNWISVYERLPEVVTQMAGGCEFTTTAKVIVWVEPGRGLNSYPTFGWRGITSHRWTDQDGMKINVTHWMPFPEPPMTAIEQVKNARLTAHGDNEKAPKSDTEAQPLEPGKLYMGGS